MQNHHTAANTAIFDRDTWLSAGKLLRIYGPNALAKAAEEVAYCSTHGDTAAEGVWKRVTSAIVLLTSTEGQLPN